MALDLWRRPRKRILISIEHLTS